MVQKKPSPRKPKTWFEILSRIRIDLGVGRGELADKLGWPTSQVKRMERGEYTLTQSEWGQLQGLLPESDCRALGDTVPTRPDPEPVAPPPVDAETQVQPAPEPLIDPWGGWPFPKFPNPSTSEHRKCLGTVLEQGRQILGETGDVFAASLGISTGVFYGLRSGGSVSWEKCNKARSAFKARVLRGDFNGRPWPASLGAPPEPSVPPQRVLPVSSVSRTVRPPAVLGTREELCARATKLISNPRLTEAEAQQLVSTLQESALGILLGEQ